MILSKQPSHDLALLKQGLSVTEAFAAWPADILQKLLPAAYLGRYQRGAIVRRESADPPEMLVVLSGHLTMSRPNADGAPATMAFVGPGMLVGVPLAHEPLDEIPCDYCAHDAVVVVHLSARVVQEILDAQPLLWKSMARTRLKQQCLLLVTLVHHLSGPLRQRLAGTLGRLAKLYGMDESAYGLRLRLRLSQGDLAAMLQVTRQSINREMGALQALGLIRAEYGAVTVRDIDALQALGRGA